MNVYLVIENRAYESTETISAHLDPAAAVKAMAEYAEDATEDYAQVCNTNGDFPRWSDYCELTLFIRAMPLT